MMLRAAEAAHPSSDQCPGLADVGSGWKGWGSCPSCSEGLEDAGWDQTALVPPWVTEDFAGSLILKVGANRLGYRSFR